MQFSKNAGHLSHFARRGTSDENAGLSLRMRDGWHLWTPWLAYATYPPTTSDTVKQSNLSIMHRVVFRVVHLYKSGGVHDKLHISSADW